MRVVHVPYLEARSLPRKAARLKRGHAPLVSKPGLLTRLIHELAKLIGAEERIDDARHGPGIDKILRCEALRIAQIHPLLNRAGHSCQAERELACELLPYCAHSTVSEVVDVVDVTLAVLEVDQLAYDRDDILQDRKSTRLK